MQETSNPKLWNQVWSRSDQENYDRDFWDWVYRESSSVRNEKIKKYLTNNLGDFRGLKFIEVGSGPGVYSFLFARLGADVTLMDYSERALDLARKHFEENSLNAKYLLQDALELNPILYDQYDVAMSFGTVEHFKYPERLKMVDAHVKLIHEGGIVIVSAPNLFFFPHEFLKAYLKAQKKWYLGYEGAFDQGEFFKVAKMLNLRNSKVIGSAFISDFQRYLRIYRATSLIQKFLGPARSTKPIRDCSCSLDDLLGADLVLLGIKGKDI